MKHFVATVLACSLTLAALPASAQEKLKVSIWGGSWRDAIADTVGKKFTAQTGAEVEFVTGGTNDRLTKAKLAGDAPETDVVFTTSHVSRLYAASGLLETLDLAKIPNAANLFPIARKYPDVLGVWSYAYTIVYRPDLAPAGMTFDSWEDLWDPRMKGMLGLHGTDPSHIIAAAAKLSGTDVANWEKAQPKLLALKPNIKAYYSSDATSQEKLASGETPVQVILTSNAYAIAKNTDLKISIPKEGAIAGIDVIGINKGTKHADLAYKFLNIVLSPEVQAELANSKKIGPMNAKAKVSPDVAALPGVFTTIEQWKDQTIVIDDKVRAEKLGQWREWFAENMMN
ncbi:ABC transporter substrate-binding protein [Ancylobacter mangrovi]|uniref:ABC transporter substrate-binding protein n=1 Tax=Ancylobacter mangrovi TaxID=2972472 RepID=UPI002161619D|nr:ABC transporter substrate-binding protein [Ancylobacter mangrovi]MCS0504885.1 ABC transporter substrate-binding protein [Ancylobacter mangrovi]